jgi:hypothetical protein
MASGNGWNTGGHPKGTKASPQGLVNGTCEMDRLGVQIRMQDEKKPGHETSVTNEEWDILDGEVVLAELKNEYTAQELQGKPQVLSTVAGLENKGGKFLSILDNHYPIGFAMDTIVFTKDDASNHVPRTDLPVKYAGVHTMNVYEGDIPVGSLVRVEVEKRSKSMVHGILGRGKKRLVPVAEKDGKPFGFRIQARGRVRFTPGVNPPAPTSPVEKAMDDFYERMADMMVTAYLVGRRLTPGGGPFPNAGACLDYYKKDNGFRRALMENLFIGAVTHEGPVQAVADQFLFPRQLLNDGSPEAEVNKKQATISATYHAALMDALRIDNKDVIGKCILGGKAPGRIDVLMNAS